jgi:UTP--glucose-1-phosphate uridylyltransferase
MEKYKSPMLLNIQAQKNKVIAYKFKGKRFDCGSVEGYLDATNHFARKIT